MIATDKQIAQDWGWKCLKLQEEVSDLRAQVEQLHADGAVMRDALESMLKASQGFQRMKAYPKAHHALSTNAGADLLARYREAVELVKLGIEGVNFDSDQIAWRKRATTLLATVKGEV